MLPGALRGVVVLGPADLGPFVPKATWPAGEAVARNLAETAERTLGERRALIVRSTVAVPVLFDGRVHGVVAVEITQRPDEQAQHVLRQLQWGVAWIELHLRR